MYTFFRLPLSFKKCQLSVADEEEDDEDDEDDDDDDEEDEEERASLGGIEEAEASEGVSF